MRRLAILLAALALSPLPASCGRTGPDGAPASVRIPFAPPLGQPLYYRFRRVVQGAPGERSSQSLFVVTFSRSSDGLIMSVSSLRPNGARASETGLPAALADRRFRVRPDGELIGMENEVAYWAALEPLLAAHGPTEAEARESRAMIQSAHDSRALPLADRMTLLAQNAWPITFYAGDVYTREAREARGIKSSIVGEIDGIRRTMAREISQDRIVVVETFSVSPDRMQAALDRLAARYGGRPEGVSSRHISNLAEIVIDIDPRTGLVRRRQDRQETVSAEGERILRRSTITVLERVDAPRPGAAPQAPDGVPNGKSAP